MRIHAIKTLALSCLLATTVHNVSAAFKVVGYEPSWQGSVSSIQFSKLTHVNYAFVLPNANGTLQALDNPSKLQSLVTSAHNAGVKVSISVGGWNDGNDSAFVSLAANSSSRTTFVNTISNFCNQYNLDGVDIDWEYPDTSSESSSYTSLMSQLSTAMHARGRTLTAAVIASGSTGDFISSTVFSKVDWLNIMDYDNNEYQHSTYASAVTSFDYWVTTRGLPASKAVLGVPFYSRPSYYGFSQLIGMGANPYSDTWNGEGYNGITTISNKTQLAYSRGGGIMNWELSQDATGANSLVSAMDRVVQLHTTTDFSISTTPSSRSVPITRPATFTSTITPVNGFSGTVTFSVTGLPSGITASFSPTSVAGSGSTTVTVNVSSSATAGSYPLVIKGTSGSLVHSNTVTLVVTDFTLTLTPTSGSVVQGDSIDYTVTIGSVNGFNGAVLLQASSIPANSFASFNPGAVVAPGTSILTVTTTASTPTGDATVTVTGSSNVLAHSDSSILTVNPPSNNGPLPAGWTDADIGAVGVGGSASYDSGTATFTLNGSGADIWGTADAFNFASIATNGDVTVVARVATEDHTAAWAKCGVMLRESTAANAAYVGLYVTPSNGVSMQIRTATGVTAIDLARQTGPGAPYWVKLVRSGNTFTGYSSADGSSWTQVGATNITMALNVLAGLADCGHNNTVLNTSTFDNVSITTGSSPVLFFEAEDISYTTNGATATLNTDTNASGGQWVLLNGNGTADYYEYTLPNVPAGTYDLALLYKQNTTRGIVSLTVDGVKLDGDLDQYGSSSYTQKDFGQVTFTTTGNHKVRLTVVGQNASSTGFTVAADAFQLTPAAATWLDGDLGAVGMAGSFSQNGGTYTVAGSGTDIWSTGDQFHYAWQNISGDVDVIARVASEQQTAGYAKAGVMIRESLATNSINACVVLTPTNGVALQVRSATGASSINVAGWVRGPVPPEWVKLSRVGNTFTAYLSADGSLWTQFASTNVTMNAGTTAGMAVTAHNNAAVNTATFDNVTIQ